MYQQIFSIIETLRDQGVTIFLVEQNANQALRIADRGYVLENGHVSSFRPLRFPQTTLC